MKYAICLTILFVVVLGITANRVNNRSVTIYVNSM